MKGQNIKVLIARPRLDWTFQRGATEPPPIEGPPRAAVLHRLGRFLDGLTAYHRAHGDSVDIKTRALYEFTPQTLNADAYDRVYMAHRNAANFPLGGRGLFYKNSPLVCLHTVDPAGWGANLSFLPPRARPGVNQKAILSRLNARAASNESIFEQPSRGPNPIGQNYIGFVCQIPTDENVRDHSPVSVAQALEAVIAYAESSGKRLLVKGHPANSKAMAPLRALAERSQSSQWIETISIHSFVEHAERTYLVNSGVGFEALLQGRPVTRFGHAEYDSVVPMALPTIASISATAASHPDIRAYEEFLTNYADRCIDIDEPSSYDRVLRPFR